MYKEHLKINKFYNVLCLKYFVCLFHKDAAKYSLFDNLSNHHKRTIRKFAIFSMLKHILSLNYSKKNNQVIVFNLWSNGYHHLITETILKIVLFEKELEQKTILIPDNSPKYVLDVLSVFPNLKFEPLKNITWFREIEIIENPNSGFFNPIHLKALKDRLLLNRSVTSSRKIYLSRKKARSRRIINEDELISHLLIKGFEIISAEDLNFNQQIDLFSNCSCFLSVHGAGLTNMTFMPENSQVIELIPEYSEYDTYEINKCYENLAKSLNFSYSSFECKRMNRQDKFDTCDIIIDMSILNII